MSEKRTVVGVLLVGTMAYMEWRDDFGPSGGCYHYPGGKAEGDEAAWDTLMREMKEEIGITPINAIQLQDVQSAEYLVQPFLVIEWEGQVPHETLDAHDKLDLLDIGSAAATSRWPAVQNIAQQVLAYLEGRAPITAPIVRSSVIPAL